MRGVVLPQNKDERNGTIQSGQEAALPVRFYLKRNREE